MFRFNWLSFFLFHFFLLSYLFIAYLEKKLGLELIMIKYIKLKDKMYFYHTFLWFFLNIIIVFWLIWINRPTSNALRWVMDQDNLISFLCTHSCIYYYYYYLNKMYFSILQNVKWRCRGAVCAGPSPKKRRSNLYPSEHESFRARKEGS